MFRNETNACPSYFIELTFDGDRVSAIRDYRYVAYIARDAETVVVD